MNAPSLSKWLLLLTPFISSTTALSAHNSTWRLSGPATTHLQTLLETLRQAYPRIAQGKPGVWEMVQIAVLCSLLPGLLYLRRGRKDSKSFSLASTEFSSNGPPLEPEGADSNGESSIHICGDVTNDGRCRIHRPRPAKEAFGDQIIHNDPLYISQGPSLLS